MLKKLIFTALTISNCFLVSTSCDFELIYNKDENGKLIYKNETFVDQTLDEISVINGTLNAKNSTFNDLQLRGNGLLKNCNVKNNLTWFISKELLDEQPNQKGLHLKFEGENNVIDGDLTIILKFNDGLTRDTVKQVAIDGKVKITGKIIFVSNLTTKQMRAWSKVMLTTLTSDSALTKEFVHMELDEETDKNKTSIPKAETNQRTKSTLSAPETKDKEDKETTNNPAPESNN